MSSCVGIDLGTTNTAVARATLGEDRGNGVPPVRDVAIPQLVAPGELAPRSTLPSFLYLAGDHDLGPQATALPWESDARTVVGTLAREQGARVPARLVASSKSWLCHPGVDRQAAILPWGSTDVPQISPVTAAQKILEHVGHAWESTQHTRLADHALVLTVPASFDELARELTAQAAERAGLGHAVLLEEPQAVFYAWLDATQPSARRALLAPGQTVLVCDVGGGTTDFSLIRVGDDGESFSRAAVGDHLLLGGDNVDVALARTLEATLGALDSVQWHGLVHACRDAKERLLGPDAPERVVVTVAARGTRLIGGTLRGEFSRTQVQDLLLDGFFPRCAQTDLPHKARVGLSEFGLPFAADPAITRHLAAFLKRHGAPRIHAVLYNGGAMTPALLRERVLDVLESWQHARPVELTSDAPELAVARGAAYYGLVRAGMGSRIGGGAARAYYVGVGDGKAICVLPRAAIEGVAHDLDQSFEVVTNRPVQFGLFSASARHDAVGDTIDTTAEDIVALPPLLTALRARGRSRAPVRLRAQLTELGTLQVFCLDRDVDERWRLTFDLRSAERTEEDPAHALHPSVIAATTLIDATFATAQQSPETLMKALELELDMRRDEWNTATIRAMADALLRSEGARQQSPVLEARWLQLAGHLVRPGMGAPLDDYRMRELWKLFEPGAVHEKHDPARLAWWILWRRVAAGLRRGQQEQLFDRIAPLFIPGANQKSKWFKRKPSPQEQAEMWRTVASLERLSAGHKTRLGNALAAELTLGRVTDVAPWALGRLGARAPLYGPADTTVPPLVALRWIDALFSQAAAAPERFVFPIAQLARRTGDRARDLDDASRQRVAAALAKLPGGDRGSQLVAEVIPLQAREERIAHGEALPSGLRLAPSE